VIDQPAVDDRLPVAVGVDRPSEDFDGMGRRGGGKADFDGIEIVDGPAVFAQVIVLVAVEEFVIAQLTIQGVATMCFIHDDAVVLADTRDLAQVRRIHDGSHQALDRGDVDFGGGFEVDVVYFLQVVDLVKGFELFEAGFLEFVPGLLTQGCAVHHKEDTAKPAAFDQAVDKTNGEPGLAGTGGHGH